MYSAGQPIHVDLQAFFLIKTMKYSRMEKNSLGGLVIFVDSTNTIIDEYPPSLACNCVSRGLFPKDKFSCPVQKKHFFLIS